MDGPTDSIAIDTLRTRAGADGVPATVRIASIAFVVAAMLAHLPTPAHADTVQAAPGRITAGIDSPSDRLDRRAPQAAGAAIRLPDAISDFAGAEPAAPTGGPKTAIYRADAPRDFEINLRFNPASDEAECDIALRLSSPRDYYVVRIDARGERVAFSRVSDGRAREITSVDRRVTANAWHSLRVGAEGDRFTVTLDGDALFTAYDTSLRRSGRLAVWTAAGSAVHFDGIAVTALAPE